MTPPPLTANNAALEQLRAWLAAQRESSRDLLETEADPCKIAHTQGRISLLNELLRIVDPKHRRYGETA